MNAEKVETYSNDRPFLGVLMFMVSLIAMAAIGGLVKFLSTNIAITQILLFRFALASIPFLIMIPHTGGLEVLRVNNRLGLCIRIFSGITALSLFFYTIGAIPLVDATALAYAAPIFVVLLSIPVLDEKIGLQRWSAVILGFIGVLIISQPTGDDWSLGYIAGVGSAFFAAIMSVSLRKLALTERTSTIAIYHNVTGAVVFAFWTITVGWAPPALEQWIFLILLGAIASAQQYLFTAAYRYSEASLLAPYDYVAMIIAAVVGYLFWAEVPSLATWIGCSIIASSGIFVAYRERIKALKTEKLLK